MKVIPYGRQNITQADIDAVVGSLTSDFLTQGPRINEFEEAFAKYIGAKYAVAVANGTAALHLAVLGMGLQPGERVITSPITFAASANCVLYAGGIVDFVDIDQETYLLDLGLLEQRLSKYPKGYYKGVVPVDFAGYPVQLNALKQICDEYGLWIIEDSCHAPGATFIDKKGMSCNSGSGAYTDAAIFSFHPVKHIAAGEGGMITTNDDELYRKLINLRTHGITKDEKLLQNNHGGWYYEMQDLGFNYRLTDLQAALGKSQLDRAEEGLKRRHQIAQKYTQAFSTLANIKTPFVADNIYHAYHLYVIQIEERKKLYDYLRTKGIYCQVHYIPVHLHPYYSKFGWKKGDFPIAESYYEKCLSLPMYPSLTDEEQEYVIESILGFYS